MPKERNKADDYREKAYAGDTKAMNNLGVCVLRHRHNRKTYSLGRKVIQFDARRRHVAIQEGKPQQEMGRILRKRLQTSYL